ncbi:phosphohistidine phosphatase SixA [Serpentinimonas maccroryi]|uniref:Phosphohistidine phosphatase SixA n=1 Tax=Serpentinimonas maccroryi TaxID=1458426 RepID=A0A060NVJ1_9BURK|nr:histidine phosphatase family protein [Serpentinimonas maccroryi]MCM2478665.1 histidine phosphatase family protein [Serpentinimonas maccroryi]MDO9610772.1 histidine phosphatase family protein [Serpentinimonas sp.]OYX59783.1 MAG: histidine phosphatase family protein [Comamonadaceae bacterium 32-67-11]BAO83578.1 phosphohistidine phosphatase SixA [Serpentinimonas maccroryi]
MDLILWRHAEAEDLEETEEGCGADLSRRLTPKGERQALRMAAWLDRQLPEGVRVYCSPAVRTEQTVIALGRKYKARDELRPDGSVDELLQLVQWPDARQPALVVGHQPTLGRTVARLLDWREEDCSIRKGSVWWLRQRERDGRPQTVIVTVQTPELL